jgi:hypothetical protein
MHLVIKHLIKVESVICCSIVFQVSISAKNIKSMKMMSNKFAAHSACEEQSHKQKTGILIKVTPKPYVESFDKELT